MLHRAARSALLAAAAPCLAQVPQVPAAAAPLPALAERFCAECHRGDDAERGFRIDGLFAAAPPAERVATAVQRLHSRTMPPPDADAQPTDEERFALAAAIAERLPTDPEARRPTLRRLSRRQYERTVHDLLGVEVDTNGRLPDDAKAYGFETIGDVANTSPALFEAYWGLAGELAARTPAAADRPFAEDLPLLLARAFRRPPTADELAARRTLFERVLHDGGDAAARTAVLQSVLASPTFLCRAESGRPDDPRRLTDHELAVRLSYLLRGSMPDAPLAADADAGHLSDPAVLAGHAHRLVAATEGLPFAEEFFAQWLRLREVLTANADFRRYPQIWNGNLRPAFYAEALGVCQAIVRDDLPITTLLDADFTIANAALCAHYGLPKVDGEQFRKVPLPDRRRGGILGMGAMLMVASYPLRTSPVLRGRWILDQLLDAPPPPPPANVPKLPADDTPAAAKTLREQLEQHRKRRACAACHAQLDPLGFALENFDVVGQWRSELHGAPVDARGTLPDGREIDGPVQLKDTLLARKDDFVRAMARKLLVYAVGRPMLPADEAELTRVVAAVRAGGYRFSALLDAVVGSPLFTRLDPGPTR